MKDDFFLIHRKINYLALLYVIKCVQLLVYRTLIVLHVILNLTKLFFLTDNSFLILFCHIPT